MLKQPEHVDVGIIDTTLYENFLVNFPCKNIGDLHWSVKVGRCVIFAKIVSVIKNDSWFEVITEEKKTYSDEKHDDPSNPEYNLVPRYSIKVQVYDGTGNACFKLANADEEDQQPFPSKLYSLIGLELLFLVEKGYAGPYQSINLHDSYDVTQICHNNEICRMFNDQHYLSTDDEIAARIVSAEAAMEDLETFDTRGASTMLMTIIKNQSEAQDNESNISPI